MLGLDELTQLSIMQMPSCVSALTLIDTYLGSLYIAPCFSLASAEGDG